MDKHQLCAVDSCGQEHRSAVLYIGAMLVCEAAQPCIVQERTRVIFVPRNREMASQMVQHASVLPAAKEVRHSTASTASYATSRQQFYSHTSSDVELSFIPAAGTDCHVHKARRCPDVPDKMVRTLPRPNSESMQDVSVLIES